MLQVKSGGTASCTLAILAVMFFATLASAEEVSLAGVWVLNEAQSDNPETRLKEAMKEVAGGRAGGMRGGAGGGMGRGRGAGGHAGGGPPSGGPGGGGRMTPPALQGFIVTANTVSISQEGVELVLLDDNGFRRTVYTDGRGSSASANGPADQLRTGATIAGWEDGQLVIETTRDDGTHIVEYLRLAPDGKKLYASTSIKLVQLTRAISVNRVYDVRDDSAEILNSMTRSRQ